MRGSGAVGSFRRRLHPAVRAAADAFLKDLGAAEFSLRGHILADIALVSDERPDDASSVTISLEALTVEGD